jgi:hypothetical protein
MSDFDDENNVHSSSSDEQHLNEEDHDNLHQPSAPPTSDDNGYIVVQGAHQHSDKEALHESLNKDFADISSSVDASISKLTQKVLAEADSSTSAKETPVIAPVSTPNKSEKSSECSICPYYALGKYHKDYFIFLLFCLILFSVW